MAKRPIKGDIFIHTKTGGEYTVEGASLNVITDQIDVRYVPNYDCEFSHFTRQLEGCEKAWMRPNEDGTDRYTFVCTTAQRRAAIEALFDDDDDDD